MEKAAIILAGGFSKRFGQDKGLVKLASKPLVLHVLERAKTIADEVLVIVSSKKQKEDYSSYIPEKNWIIIDNGKVRSPLIGALTGFSNTSAEYSLLLPCDTPFISIKVIELLFETCVNVDACIPRWPNDNIEPLQAVYKTKSALKASKQALKQSEMRLLNMIQHQKRVRYLSTTVIQQLDPNLITFFNINTKKDLSRAIKLAQDGLNKNF
ncbi:molybdenum cofactor guanylyltransferase [Candidatus Bathyarchaeota archaeon]|nr:molybdenum cofactor guanylyltransferase [Candidatus Bathyarchaeota archaeon]